MLLSFLPRYARGNGGDKSKVCLGDLGREHSNFAPISGQLVLVISLIRHWFKPLLVQM